MTSSLEHCTQILRLDFPISTVFIMSLERDLFIAVISALLGAGILYLISKCKGQTKGQGSGGSRISRRGRRAPVRGRRAPVRRGMDLRRECFLVKMYVKTKELGPIGGACARHAPPPPPRSTNGSRGSACNVWDMSER